ncbi:hypothetical protein DVS77_28825 [Mycolicibacterium moriokaense]|nr:hypothetical protein DVS77_28825 [Mycolicibacterium moriokaense]
MPRSRGATSGFLVLLLGLWGALIPFLGNNFGFGYGDGGTWTAAHGWLQVLPGIAAAAGGVLLLVSRNRATAMFGGWLAVAAGAWFVVGRTLAGPLAIPEMGGPVAESGASRAALELAYFTGLGTLIVLLAAMALGRLSVRSQRDIKYAESVSDAAMRDNATIQADDTSTDVESDSARHGSWRDWFGRRSTAH